MEKLTYKEFEEIVAEMGHKISPEEEYVNVVNDYDYTLARVSKADYKVFNLDWLSFKALNEERRHLLADACWRLTSTPLEDREEPKKYYLRLKPQFDYLKRYSPSYLIRDPEMVGDMCASSIAKMAFTDAQIKDMSKTYDLSIFKKVEVEDE